MIKRIVYPEHIRTHGITKTNAGHRGPWNIMGADTETVQGLPHTLQMCPDGTLASLDYVNEKNILRVFLQAVEFWAKSGRINTVWFHHLKFDLQIILIKYQKYFGLDNREFTLDLVGAKIHVFADKTWFARVHFSDHRVVHILDTHAFFHCSLEKAAKTAGSPIPKLPKPQGLGKEYLKGKAFERYAKTDAVACWHVARAIETMHYEHDAALSVSAPHFATRVFRHHYLLTQEKIMFPPSHIARAAELSYHGGKNNQTVAAGWYGKSFGTKPVYELDLISAYSAAMIQLPPMTLGKYRMVKKISRGVHGIACITGEAFKACKWGCVFTHNFKPVFGKFDRIWITTYELDSALKHRCIKLKRCWGYVWDAGSLARNPFKVFAQYFFDKKKSYKPGTLEYEFNKICNNSLYGKLYATIRDKKIVEADGEGNARLIDQFRASGLFSPFWASLITGYVRALMHGYEHKYDSMHSSTDGFKTTRKPDPRDLGGIGKLKIECVGDCLLLRPKLYLHLDGKGKVAKYAMHGMRGDHVLLRKAAKAYLAGKEFEYFDLHCYQSRELLRRGEFGIRPLSFHERRRVLRPPKQKGEKIK